MDLVPEYTALYLRRVNLAQGEVISEPQFQSTGWVQDRLIRGPTIQQAEIHVYVTPARLASCFKLFPWEVRVLCLTDGMVDDYLINGFKTLVEAKAEIDFLAAYEQDKAKIRTILSRRLSAPLPTPRTYSTTPR